MYNHYTFTAWFRKRGKEQEVTWHVHYNEPRRLQELMRRTMADPYATAMSLARGQRTAWYERVRSEYDVAVGRHVRRTADWVRLPDA